MNYKPYFALEPKLKAEGFTETRSQLVHKFTKGNTDHLSELSEPEFKKFLDWVRKKLDYRKDRHNKMRRKIISLFHKMGYQVNGQIDMDHLNNWCVSHGHLHKELMEYKGNDLVKLVTQAEIYYESYIKTL